MSEIFLSTFVFENECLASRIAASEKGPFLFHDFIAIVHTGDPFSFSTTAAYVLEQGYVRADLTLLISICDSNREGYLSSHTCVSVRLPTHPLLSQDPDGASFFRVQDPRMIPNSAAAVDASLSASALSKVTGAAGNVTESLPGTGWFYHHSPVFGLP